MIDKEIVNINNKKDEDRKKIHCFGSSMFTYYLTHFIIYNFIILIIQMTTYYIAAWDNMAMQRSFDQWTCFHICIVFHTWQINYLVSDA